MTRSVRRTVIFCLRCPCWHYITTGLITAEVTREMPHVGRVKSGEVVSEPWSDTPKTEESRNLPVPAWISTVCWGKAPGCSEVGNKATRIKGVSHKVSGCLICLQVWGGGSLPVSVCYLLETRVPWKHKYVYLITNKQPQHFHSISLSSLHFVFRLNQSVSTQL